METSNTIQVLPKEQWLENPSLANEWLTGQQEYDEHEVAAEALPPLSVGDCLMTEDGLWRQVVAASDDWVACIEEQHNWVSVIYRGNSCFGLPLLSTYGRLNENIYTEDGVRDILREYVDGTRKLLLEDTDLIIHHLTVAKRLAPPKKASSERNNPVVQVAINAAKCCVALERRNCPLCPYYRSTTPCATFLANALLEVVKMQEE